MMTKSPSKTLTDDGISSFITELIMYLDDHAPGFVEWSNDDENFDKLNEEIYNLLGPYSNGYVNYN